MNIPENLSIYGVVKGDTLWKIAQKNNTDVKTLIGINRLNDLNIQIGQKILVPSQKQQRAYQSEGNPEEFQNQTRKSTTTVKEYKVEKGDTSWTISIKFGVPMPEFLQLNQVSESDSLMVGQTVKIPVHSIPVTQTPGERYGEYLDWFQAAQYLFPVNAIATVTDFATGTRFKVKRVTGAFHSDTEPLTREDTEIIKNVWGGTFSWKTRPVTVQVNGRKIAASMTSMPHSVDFISDNNFNGHFDIHFLNSLRHKDGKLDVDHQASVKVAALP